MKRSLVYTLLGAVLAVQPAYAGLVFLPHIGEYGKAVAGQYGGISFYHASYNAYFSRDAQEIVVPDGGADVNTVFLASAWVGNLFRDTDIPFFSSRPQVCALGLPIAQVQARGSVRANAELGGLAGGNNGIGDLLGLCSIQDVTRVWGPVRGHFQFTTTVKFPIGDYDTGSLFNFATNYWTYVPQLSYHADIGRLVVDATIARQFNENNDEPSSAGDVPTRPSDWENAAINLGWKFSYRWAIDAGFAYNRTTGPNYYDQFDVKPARQPVAGSGFCGGFGPQICNTTGTFYLQPRPGPYADRGLYSRMVTAGVYYIYRSSAILNLRVAKVIDGRGSQFDTLYDVCTETPCGPSNSRFQVPFVATGVGEAAAIISQPFYELRFIFPMAAF